MSIKTRHHRRLGVALFGLALVACSDTEAMMDDEDATATSSGDGSECGADLENDPDNCGECGNVCDEGWMSGGCLNGVCQATWRTEVDSCDESGEGYTCEMRCQIWPGTSCVENGCGGATMLWTSDSMHGSSGDIGDKWLACAPEQAIDWQLWSGACDVPVGQAQEALGLSNDPEPDVDAVGWAVECCCAPQ